VLDLAGAADTGTSSTSLYLGGEPDGFQRVYARLALHHALDWDACAPDHGFVRLPSYPWQRESYWLARPAADATAALPAAALPVAAKAAADKPAHPLLGQRLALPAPAWENPLDPERLPYLADHHVQGLKVLPGAAYAELGLAIHREVSDAAHGVLHDLEFHKALVIGADDQPALHVAYDPSRRAYSVHSRRRPGAAWKLHARGRLSLVAPAAAPRVALTELKQRCAQVVEAAAHYENMDERGLEYGRYFQGVRRLWL